MAAGRFVKLYTKMLHHPGIGRLSDSAHRTWITALLLAADEADGGRVGTVEYVAWTMRREPEDIHVALEEIDGRVRMDEDGVLWIRDWAEWQTLAVSPGALRQRRWRARLAGRQLADEDSGDAPDRPRDAAETQRGVSETHRNVSETRRNGSDGSETRRNGAEANRNVRVRERGRERVTTLAIGDDSAANAGSDSAPSGRAARGTKSLTTEQQELFGAICSWMGVQPAALSGSTKANVGTLARAYAKAGETAETVHADAALWFRHGFPGRDGQPPTVKQATDWRARCRSDNPPGGRRRNGAAGETWTLAPEWDPYAPPEEA